MPSGDSASGRPIGRRRCPAVGLALLALGACQAPAKGRPVTTDADIALGNLEAQIAALHGALERTGVLADDERATLVDRLLARGRFLGRIADYERALGLGDRFVRESPKSPRSYLVRARTRSAMHRFKEALTDLEEGERLGLREDPELQGTRIAVLQAMGRYGEATALRARAATSPSDVAALGLEATSLGERGRLLEAEALFETATKAYRGVSPFAVAWLYHQRGTMWMRAEKLERARELLEQAHSVLRKFAAAATHLAEVEARLGNTGRAISLLREVVASSDDPDPMAKLALILAQSGDALEAARLRRVVAARFQELTRAHPEAFSDHAAEFWLGAGGDPRKALALARANLEARRTPSAYGLVIEAALAAQDQAEACRVASSPEVADFPSLRPLVTRTAAVCGGSSASAPAVGHPRHPGEAPLRR